MVEEATPPDRPVQLASSYPAKREWEEDAMKALEVEARRAKAWPIDLDTYVDPVLALEGPKDPPAYVCVAGSVCAPAPAADCSRSSISSWSLAMRSW